MRSGSWSWAPLLSAGAAGPAQRLLRDGHLHEASLPQERHHPGAAVRPAQGTGLCRYRLDRGSTRAGQLGCRGGRGAGSEDVGDLLRRHRDRGGELKPSAQIGPIMEALRGHDTLVWLHLGGKGPKIETLSTELSRCRTVAPLAAYGRAERPEDRDLSPRRRLDRALQGRSPGCPTGRSQELRRDVQPLPRACRGR